MTFSKTCPECDSMAVWEYDIDYPETHVPECQFAGYRCTECEWEHEDPDKNVPDCHPVIKKLVDELGGKYSRFYRAVYKSTDCGPSIGFKVANLPHPNITGWLYCDDLPSKSPDDFPACAISVSSIVEGSDAEVPATILEGDFTEQDFWDTLKNVNNEAIELWKEANIDYNIVEQLYAPIKEVTRSAFRTTNDCPDYLKS